MPQRRGSRRAAVLFLLAATAAVGQAQQDGPLDEANALILQPYLDRVPLGDGILGFPAKRPTVLLPLGELSRLLSLGITVQGDKGLASGFFISPKRHFSLDLAARTVEVEGRRLTFDPGQVRPFKSDLYVDARLLQAWLPLDLDVDLRGSAVQIKARERLPIQAAWEREKRYGGKLGFSSDPEALRQVPRYPSPYAFLDVPMVDLLASWRTSQRGDASPIQGAVMTSGDLLWMSSELYLTRDANGSFTSSRGTLFRDDPAGGLLGPLHATHVELVDLASPSLELAGPLPSGRGALLDNYPTSYRSTFAARTFRGALPEGWTVELYQNDSLVSFQRSRSDGQYEFLDVPMRFGLNQFRLVFHGPLGQRMERAYRLDIAQEQPPPGVFYYRVAGWRPRTMYVATPLSSLDPASVPTTLDPTDRTALLAEGEYGLSSTYSVKGGFSRVAVPTGQHDYSVLGLRAVFPFLSLQLNGAQDRATLTDGTTPRGLAAEGVLMTGFGYSSLTLRRSEYRRRFFKLGVSDRGEVLRTEDFADVSTPLPSTRIPLSLYLQHQRQVFLDSAYQSDRLQITASLDRLSISPMLTRILTRRNGLDSVRTEGTLYASSFGESLNLMGSFTFAREQGRTRFQSWSLGADYRKGEGLLYRMGLLGTSGSLRDTAITASVTQMTGRFSYGVDGQYSRGTGYSIGLRLSASFGREPRTGAWIMDARTMSPLGAVSATAYMDDNANGRRDPDERVLEDVGFKVSGSRLPERRPDPKVAVYTHVGRSQDLAFQVDEGTLEDASMRPAVPSYRILPRPGKFLQVDYPITIMGEVTGTTRIRKAGKSEELPGLEVEIATPAGVSLKAKRSAYDGFFEFMDLPPGDYVLRITPEEIRRLHLKKPPSRALHIDQKRSLLDGLDLVIDEAPEPPEPPKTPPPKASEPAPVQPPPPSPPPVKPDQMGTHSVGPAPGSPSPNSERSQP